MITDHPYKPCFHDKPGRRGSAEAIFGLCMCPYGMYRCHIKGCGKKESEHAESERPQEDVEGREAAKLYDR